VQLNPRNDDARDLPVGPVGVADDRIGQSGLETRFARFLGEIGRIRLERRLRHELL
jgi:hypothetical protein